MKKTFFFIAAALFSTGAFAQSTWKVDKMHSHLTFTITHLAVSDVDGTFKDFDATITASKPDFSDATFQFIAEAASVNTGVDQRDTHLKSPDFFDATKYPTVTFTSTSIKPSGSAGHYTMTGKLTLGNVTKPVTVDLWYRGTITNPMSKAPDAGFQVTGTVKRSDFNFGSKFGSPMLSDEVTFKAAGEFGKAN
jgi:polyisoprenoid-binding protein YceI